LVRELLVAVVFVLQDVGSSCIHDDSPWVAALRTSRIIALEFRYVA
jgi:hypothetical protein